MAGTEDSMLEKPKRGLFVRRRSMQSIPHAPWRDQNFRLDRIPGAIPLPVEYGLRRVAINYIIHLIIR